MWLTPYNFVLKIRFLRYLSRARLPRILYDGSTYFLVGWICRWIYQYVRSLRNGDSRAAALRKQRDLFETLAAIVSTLFLRRAYALARENVDQLVDLERRVADREALAFEPPPKRLLRLATGVYRSVCEPVFVGLEHVPDFGRAEHRRPLLFVSNHSILALELPLLIEGLYTRRNMWLRPLADHAHFQIPINGSVLRNVFGCVEGTPRHCDLLFENNQAVLVYDSLAALVLVSNPPFSSFRPRADLLRDFFFLQISGWCTRDVETKGRSKV